MKFSLVLKSIAVVVLVIFVASCDDDYNELGTNILGDDHYLLDSIVDYPVAYTQTMGPVQTSDLPVNSLGVYKMGDFGTIKASYLTQLGLSSGNVKIHSDLTDVVNSAGVVTSHYGIDSVYVYIPYYSTVKSTNSDTGNSTYELDSIMPSAYTGKKIKLEIKRSTLELNQYDLDEGLTQIKKYYSNDQAYLESNLSDVLLNAEINADDSQRIFYKKTTDPANPNGPLIAGTASNGAAIDSRLAPGIFSLLDANYFKDLLLDAKAEGALLNNNTFRNFFKGLYLKAESPDNLADGFMARFNFANAKIVIIYHDKYSSTVPTPTRKVLSLGFTGRSVNVFDTSGATAINDGVATGDDRLFVKGGEGAQAVITIPQTTISDLKTYKAKVNDAAITFTLDSDFNDDSANIAYPKRFYLYDLETRRVLLDYTYDPSTSSSTKYNKYIYGGIEKTIDGKKRVRFNITNHMRNLVKTFKADEAAQDSIGNYKLGLAITENINVGSLYRRKNVTSVETLKHPLKYVPIMSVCSPLGAKFYGSKIDNNNTQDTRVKLEIWYTKQED